MTRFNPAERRSFAFFFNNDALVVSAISISNLDNLDINSGKFFRSRGSPPVIRTFSKPKEIVERTTFSISSKDKNALFGKNV